MDILRSVYEDVISFLPLSYPLLGYTLKARLYARNTTMAMTKKLMILEIRSPYLNTVVPPARFGTVTVSAR